MVLAPAYPVDEGSYGGQPIARRVSHYVRAGLEVTVFVPTTDGSRRTATAAGGLSCHFGPAEDAPHVAAEAGIGQLAVHSPTPEMWAVAEPIATSIPTHLWMHGFESRDWRLLWFDYTKDELTKLAERLDAINLQRQETLRKLFADESITKIFVSSYLRSVGERFVGVKAQNGHVIHNVIDTDVFAFRERRSDERFSVSSVRSFERRNYGTDMVRDAVLRLSKQPWFDELRIRIVGDGKHHEEDTAPLRRFENIRIEKRFVGCTELIGLLDASGISLLPTRWDSQGMMMGESMASGAVAVTNAVTAIPEFVDESCAVLAGPDDAGGLADGIATLIDDPDRFVDLSRQGRVRVEKQCGPDATVIRELALFDRFR